MSLGYWGIVGALVVMVGMLLVCLTLLAPNGKGSLPTRSDHADEPTTAPRHAQDTHRRAA
jgi:hypothetical protein